MGVAAEVNASSIEPTVPASFNALVVPITNPNDLTLSANRSTATVRSISAVTCPPEEGKASEREQQHHHNKHRAHDDDRGAAISKKSNNNRTSGSNPSSAERIIDRWNSLSGGIEYVDG